MDKFLAKNRELLKEFSILLIDEMDKAPHKWDLHICKADNGFILTTTEGDQEVIECIGDEREIMTELLIAVFESFGSMDIQHSKFGNENLNITWDKVGTHYISPEEILDINALSTEHEPKETE